MNDRTTITISKETKKELDKLGNKNESYDKLIRRLMKDAVSKKPS